MFVLCAHYLGTVADEHQAAFGSHVETTHMPMVAEYPGLSFPALPERGALE